MMDNSGKKAGWLFCLMAVWVIFFQLFGGRWLNGLSMPLLLLVSQLVYLIPVFLFIIIGKISLKSWIPHGGIKISVLCMTVLFVLLLQPLMVCLNLATMLFSNNYVMETQSGLADLPLLAQLALIALLPAVSEEFMFRGIFYGAFRKQGIVRAAVISGLVFGMLHLNFNQFGYACMLGIAFALLLEATGSIFYCMIGHFAVNGLSVVISFVTGAASEFTPEKAAQVLTRDGILDALCIYLILAFFTTALAAWVYAWIAGRMGRFSLLEKEKRESLKAEKRQEFIPLLLGSALCLGFMVFRDLISG